MIVRGLFEEIRGGALCFVLQVWAVLMSPMIAMVWFDKVLFIVFIFVCIVFGHASYGGTYLRYKHLN